MKRSLLLVFILIALAAATVVSLMLSEDTHAKRAVAIPEHAVAPAVEARPNVVIEAAPDIVQDEALAPVRDEVQEGTPARRTEIPSERRLRVVTAEGTPVAEARVALFEGDELRFVGATNSAGRLVVPEEEVATCLAIAPRKAPPHAALIRWGEGGEGEVILPAGRRVAGVVLLDGAPPPAGESVSLELRSGRVDRGRLTGGFEGLADSVWEAIGIDKWESNSSGIDTLPDGSFAFHGLADDWSGTLSFPLHYHFDPDHEHPQGLMPVWRSYQLVEPREDIVIHLTRGLIVRGRVVTQDGSEPIPRARVSFKHRASNSSGTSSGTADEEGCFEFSADPFGTLSIEVRVADGEGRAPQRHAYGEVPTTKVWDLGDLSIAPSWAVTLRVVDPDGAPIEGASICGWIIGRGDSKEMGEEGNRLGTTNEEGLCRVESGAQLSVSAPRFERTTVELPLVVPDVLEVELQPSSTLEIHLITTDETPKGIELAVVSAEPLFLENNSRHPPASRMNDIGVRFYSSSYSSSSGELKFPLPESGVAVLSGLRPHMDIQLRIVGPAGATAVEKAVKGLYPGEQRKVELVVTAPATRFTGTVVDADGFRVRGAKIRLGSTTRPTTNRVKTDKDGRFEISGFLPRNADLVVEANGHAKLHIDDWALPSDGGDVTLTLPRSRTVRVLVLSGGEASHVGSLWWYEDGQGRQGRARAENEWRVVAGVLEDVTEFELWFGGGVYTQAIASGDTEVIFEVPALGKIEVEFTGARLPVEGERWRLGTHLKEGKSIGRVARWMHETGATELEAKTLGSVVEGTHILLMEAFGSSIDVTEVLYGPVEVEVVAGQTTRLRIEM